MNKASITIAEIGLSEMRHVLYKCKSTAQFWSPGFQPPYTTDEEIQRYISFYCGLFYLFLKIYKYMYRHTYIYIYVCIYFYTHLHI
jgi:hypothetical protein